MSRTSISFVLPMFNEKAGIADTIDRVTSLAREIAPDYEIVIADDASTDKSVDIAEEIAARDPHVKVIRLKKNTKFGGALKAGIERARKDVILYTDSDLPVKSKDIRAALRLLNGADIVTGYSTARKDASTRRVIMSKVYNALVRTLFRSRIKDINSGFKIYKRAIFSKIELHSKSPFINVEIFMKARRHHFKTKQYPLVFKHRDRGKSYIARPAVVLATFTDMIKFRLGMYNR